MHVVRGTARGETCATREDTRGDLAKSAIAATIFTWRFCEATGRVRKAPGRQAEHDLPREVAQLVAQRSPKP